MKTPPQNPEQEKYFAAKNARRQWWKKNWVNFLFYPASACGVGIFFYFCCVIVTNVGLTDWIAREKIQGIADIAAAKRVGDVADRIAANEEFLNIRIRAMERRQGEQDDEIAAIKLNASRKLNFGAIYATNSYFAITNLAVVGICSNISRKHFN